MNPERRRWFQAGFFALFVLAPALDLLRFDLTGPQLIVLGQHWSLGLDTDHAPRSIILQGFLPALLLAAAFITVAWRYGRLYCGWLCPHFSAVELLNDLLHRAIGRFSLWERQPTPLEGRRRDRRWLPVFVFAAMLLGALWAVTLLTYLLPPARVWSHLLHGEPTANEARFLVVASVLFTLEFVLARHLFCRFGCAVGLFQSLAWMANPRGLVIGFAAQRAAACRSCTPPAGNACDRACPMRLKPRQERRWMFSCVQCGRCLKACRRSVGGCAEAAPLVWTVDVASLRRGRD